MFRFYLALTIIIINGFIPSGKFNAIYTLISWNILTIQILWDIKKLSSKSVRIIPLILSLSLIGTVCYIYPYKEIYNLEAMKDVMISMLNSFIFLIIGIQFRLFLIKSAKKYKFNSKFEVSNSVDEIFKLQKINLFMTILLIIVGPYLTKIILFQKDNINNFFLDNSIYILNLIDFTSINFLSLSFKNSTRNSFLLIPLIFIFISYKLIKIFKTNEGKILQNSDQKDIDNIFIKMKLSYICTYMFSVIYLLCSSTRVGVFIGYALLILFLFNLKILCRSNESFNENNNSKQSKKLILKVILSFLITIILIPYQFFFPYSCRGEVSYNTILINSTLPIIYEFRNFINRFTNNEVPNIQTLCRNPKYTISLKPAIFAEYNSSSYKERLKIYTQDKICDAENKCQPLIRHESLIRDLFYPLGLTILTIPISIIFLIVWFALIFKYLISISNKKYLIA